MERCKISKKKYFRCFEVSTGHKKWKGVKSEKIKVFPLFWSKYLSSWTGPDMSKSRLFRSGHVQITTFQVRTCPNHDFWLNFKCFGFKIRFLTKWRNDSASFLLEKLKNQVFLIKNLNIWPKIPGWGPGPGWGPYGPIFFLIL